MKFLAAIALACVSAFSHASSAPNVGNIAPLANVQPVTFETVRSNAFGMTDVKSPEIEAPLKPSRLMIKVQWSGGYANQTSYLFAEKGVAVDIRVLETTLNLEKFDASKPLCDSKQSPHKAAVDSINASFLLADADQQGASLVTVTRATTASNGNSMIISDTCTMIDQIVLTKISTRRDHFSYGKPISIYLGKNIIADVSVIQVPGT